jgi:hypothetical protein
LDHAKQQTQVCYHESLESQTQIGVAEFWHKAKAVRGSVTPTSRALAFVLQTCGLQDLCEEYASQWNNLTGDSDSGEQVFQESEYGYSLALIFDIHNILHGYPR